MFFHTLIGLISLASGEFSSSLRSLGLLSSQEEGRARLGEHEAREAVSLLDGRGSLTDAGLLGKGWSMVLALWMAAVSAWDRGFVEPRCLRK